MRNFSDLFFPASLLVFFLSSDSPLYSLGPTGRRHLRVHGSRQDGVPAPRGRARGRQHGDGGARLRRHDAHGGHTISCCLRHTPGPPAGRSGTQ